MALVGFQYEAVSLEVNKVCFNEEQNIPNMHEQSSKIQSVTEWCRYRKCGVMDRNVECAWIAAKLSFGTL